EDGIRVRNVNGVQTCALPIWCQLRKDYRMFRVDRIENFQQSGDKLSDTSEHSLKEFSEQSLHKERDLHEVVIYFDREMKRYMGDQKYYYGWVDEKEVNGGVEMTFLISSTEYFARWLLTWGDGVEVVESEGLKARVRELSEELYHHHHV